MDTKFGFLWQENEQHLILMHTQVKLFSFGGLCGTENMAQIFKKADSTEKSGGKCHAVTHETETLLASITGQ